jgi:hypothetical protein
MMKQMAAAVVWIIEQDHWPRASLRAELIERGYDAVGFESVDDAVAALRVPWQPRPGVVVVDLTGQRDTAAHLVPFSRLGTRLVAIGSAVEAPGEAARALPWSTWLQRPVSLGRVADAVEAQGPRSLRT